MESGKRSHAHGFQYACKLEAHGFRSSISVARHDWSYTIHGGCMHISCMDASFLILGRCNCRQKSSKIFLFFLLFSFFSRAVGMIKLYICKNCYPVDLWWQSMAFKFSDHVVYMILNCLIALWFVLHHFWKTPLQIYS